MKTKYMKPQIETLEMEVETPVMTNSIGVSNDEIQPGDGGFRSKRRSLWDDEE